MWSTWVKGAALLLLVAALVEAQKEGCVCGGLGSGSNPCTCNEVVVKAAKVSTPLQYVSPEVINEAAALHDCEKPPYIAALQAASAGNSKNVVFVNANSQSSGLASASVVYDAAPAEVVISPPDPDSNGDCGCGSKKPQVQELLTLNTNVKKAPVKIQELLTLNPNAKIVPNFPPIGDLCTHDNQNSELKSDGRIKVTPAYPGKLKCCEGTPYEECVKIIQGIRGGPSRLIDVSRGTYNGKYGTLPAVPYDAPVFFNGVNEGGFGRPSQNPLNLLPADPISLSLAYKNIVAPAINYKKGKPLVSEGGLSFGHRTIPIEAKNEKKTPDIPEEKLLTVDKPVVELKISPPNPLTVGDNNDDEEDLAELEAMEQENFDQKEQIDRVTSSFLSYGDVGYAPIDMTVSRPIITINPPVVNGGGSLNGGMSAGSSDAGPEGPCGPIGPPLEDYVPGNVVLQQEYIEPEAPKEPEETDIVYNGDASIASNEDPDGSGAGIIAKIRSSSRNYGGTSSCSR